MISGVHPEASDSGRGGQRSCSEQCQRNNSQPDVHGDLLLSCLNLTAKTFVVAPEPGHGEPAKCFLNSTPAFYSCSLWQTLEFWHIP